jgi:hypothetical protein
MLTAMSKQGKKWAMSLSLWDMWSPEGCWIAVYPKCRNRR